MKLRLKQVAFRSLFSLCFFQATAEAICRRIGVFGPDEDTTGLSLSGKEFDELTKEQQKEACRKAR